MAIEIVGALTACACPHYIGLPERNCGGNEEEDCPRCWQEAIDFLKKQK